MFGKNIDEAYAQNRQKSQSEDLRKLEKTVESEIKHEQEKGGQNKQGNSIEGGVEPQQPLEAVDFTMDNVGQRRKHTLKV